MNPENSPDFWQQIYDAGDTRWDLGGPTPAFVALHERLKFPPGPMLVPGCGRGYDAVYFAQQGFAVTAVDFAESAVRDARANAERAGVELAVLQEDIFALAGRFPQAFDYVLEYTCFCAIAPERREEYAGVIRDVMRPNGALIGLFFPMDVRPAGPPFAVTEEEIITMFSPHFQLELSEEPRESVSPRRGKERMMVWRKE